MKHFDYDEKKFYEIQSQENGVWYVIYRSFSTYSDMLKWVCAHTCKPDVRIIARGDPNYIWRATGLPPSIKEGAYVQ